MTEPHADGTRVLRQSTGSVFRLLVFAVLLTAGSGGLLYSGFRQGFPDGLFSVIFGGLGGVLFGVLGLPVMVLQLVKRPTLTLTASGIEHMSVFGKVRTWLWRATDVVRTNTRTRTVFWTDQSGRNGTVAGGYGDLNADKLAALLNAYRSAAIHNAAIGMSDEALSRRPAVFNGVSDGNLVGSPKRRMNKVIVVAIVAFVLLPFLFFALWLVTSTYNAFHEINVDIPAATGQTDATVVRQYETGSRPRNYHTIVDYTVAGQAYQADLPGASVGTFAGGATLRIRYNPHDPLSAFPAKNPEGHAKDELVIWPILGVVIVVMIAGGWIKKRWKSSKPMGNRQRAVADRLAAARRAVDPMRRWRVRPIWWVTVRTIAGGFIGLSMVVGLERHGFHHPARGAGGIVFITATLVLPLVIAVLRIRRAQAVTDTPEKNRGTPGALLPHAAADRDEG